MRPKSLIRTSGFTLVEVLCAVVIAVMGFMTVLALMGAVRDKAVWVICHDAAVSAAA